MVVPLAIGAAFATFAPQTASFFGSFTGALFHGALPILAVFYVCMGSTIALGALPRVDVVLSYAGADGTMVEAAVAAGARGLVSSGFAPG